MKLMIVESPTKAKKIQSLLGNDWKIVATLGHIRDLSTEGLGIDIKKAFMPIYVINKDKAKLVSYLKKLVLAADEIYIASDPDREGESIAHHTVTALKITNYKRITFNEISKDAILNSIKNPRQIDLNLFSSQEARRVLDRIYGFEISPILSKQSNLNLSAGRVQSPTLKIIYMRDDEIKRFVKQEYFELSLNICGIDLNCVNTSLCDLAHPKDHIYDISIFQNVVDSSSEFAVSVINEKPVSIKPKPGFTTSSLQQSSSSIFGFSPTRTMQIAQSLFEAGYITYHRTDSPNISLERFDSVVSYLKTHNLPVRDSIHRYAAVEGSQEAHEAIVCTQLHMTVPDDLDEDTANLYRLIRERTLMLAMPDAIVATTKIVASCTHKLEGKCPQFEFRNMLTVEQGWRKYRKIDLNEEKNPVVLPENLPELIKVSPENFKITRSVTKPPKRYTPADLIKLLEKLSIGRPSTYASIIDTLIERKYLVVDEKFLEITELGRKVIKALESQDILNLAFTKAMEAELDNIANGKGTYLTLVEHMYQLLQKQKKLINFPKS